jgi:phospholipid transport system substrate-binding protein
MARWLVGALAYAGALAPPAPAAESPRAVVEATTNAVIAVLANNRLSADEKRRRVEEIVYARVDFDTLSRLVLGRGGMQLSEGQRGEFQREFKQILSATYGRNVERYKNERVTIIDEREEARGDRTVRTKIVGHGADDISVDYRLRQTDGTWKIIDVVIDGVSLVSNYRSQFQEIMAKGGIDRLLELLREKNARGEALPAPKGANRRRSATDPSCRNFGTLPKSGHARALRPGRSHQLMA